MQKTYFAIKSKSTTRSCLPLKTHDKKNLRAGSAIEKEGKEEHTCGARPNMPMRSNIANHLTCVGITGEILNTIMLEYMSRGSSESS